jgi:mediator of RNA polymerase II transcription subunit 16
MLKVTVDYSEDTHHDQLIRNTLLQLCFSVLNQLSFRGEFKPRSLTGKFASLALGVRNIFVVITVASNSPIGYKDKLIPLDDPEVVDAVVGCTKWGYSLLAWLTNSLFELLDDPEIMAMLGDPKRFPELGKYLQSKDDVALQLLLCSSTRGFLLAACRRLMHVETISSRTSQYYDGLVQQQQKQDPTASAASARPHPALYHAYQRMARALSTPLVKVSEFERLLSDLSTDIHAAYQRSFSGLSAAKVKPQQHANMTEQQQQQLNEQFVKKALAHCELDMLLDRTPPPSFRDVLLRFFSTTLPAFRAQTDPAKLYFANYDLLEMGENPKIFHARKAMGRYVDVFKRVELAVGPPRRKRTADGGEKNPAGGGGGGGGSGGSGAPRLNILHGVWTGIGGDSGPQWRRCVRCAAVMEDIWSGKPGYNFVLSQQRKCVCGGSWGSMPRGS